MVENIKNVLHLWDICRSLHLLASAKNKLFLDFHIFFPPAFLLTALLKLTCMVAKLILMLPHSSAIRDRILVKKLDYSWCHLLIMKAYGKLARCHEC